MKLKLKVPITILLPNIKPECIFYTMYILWSLMALYTVCPDDHNESAVTDLAVIMNASPAFNKKNH